MDPTKKTASKVYYNFGEVNGRQYWATDKNAIWFDGHTRNKLEHTRTYFDWMYGKLEYLGSTQQITAQAVSNEKAKCPTRVKDWHYSASYSNDDSKIFTKIECVCKL